MGRPKKTKGNEMRTAMTKKMAEQNYSAKGEPLPFGHRCATCGDMAAWGRHPGCERDGRGRLMVWKKEE